MAFFNGIKDLATSAVGSAVNNAVSSAADSQRHIVISTGDIRNDYGILDAIFAMDSHKEGFISVADPDKAFEGVKNQLSKKCRSLGGDAVINCEFQYRIALTGNKQTVEIFAYGTAVKFI